eukprot:COSAG02_NODE_2536_length_8579_cov_4.816863_11_plen_95_part_01
MLRQKAALVQLAKTLLLWRNAVQRVLCRATRGARRRAHTHCARAPVARERAGAAPAQAVRMRWGIGSQSICQSIALGHRSVELTGKYELRVGGWV